MTKVMPAERRAKPSGGFVLPLVWQLLAAWWCYRSGALTLRGLRVWMALWELDARRCTLAAERRPRFRIEELQALVGGVGGRHLRADLRRLRALGLVRFGAGSITFPSSPEEIREFDLEGFWRLFALVPNNRRRVPLPRRVVRFLAGSSKRVLFATVLGEALRLLYFKGGEVHSRGRCKASWIGEVFTVDLRGVKRARRHLEQIRLLVPVGDGCSRERVFERRWGKATVWNLDWEVESGLPPVSTDSTTDLPPVESDNETPSEIDRDQKPALRGPAPGSSSKKVVAGTRPPTVRDIVPADLERDERTVGLFADAVERGLVSDSEAGRLRFFGLVEHALRYGTTNRPGLFRALLERQRWHFITQDDEERARRRLHRVSYGEALGEQRDARVPAMPQAPRELSADARFVLAAQREFARIGVRTGVFEYVRQARPEWTEARWTAALDELRPAEAAPVAMVRSVRELLSGMVEVKG